VLYEALTLLAVLIAFLLAIIPIVSVGIKQSGRARVLEPVKKEALPGAHRLMLLHRPWAAHFHFEWIGGYRFRGLDGRFVGAFRHAEQPVFLLVELIKGATHYELLSVFNREQTLTTTSLNAVVPPNAPDGFVQRFPTASLSELFRQHTRAHDFLLARGHVSLEPHAVRVDRAVIDVLARSHAFVTSLPAWPLRTIAWVLFGPRRARDKSVEAQLAGVAPARQPETPSQESEPERASGPRARTGTAAADAEAEEPIDADTEAEVEALVARALPGRKPRAQQARAEAPKPAAAQARPQQARAEPGAQPRVPGAARNVKAERTR
jgi:hypothetical protein